MVLGSIPKPSKKLTWYYAFCEGDRTTLPSKITKKNFSHVVFFSQCGPTTISIEPLSTAINIVNYYNLEEAYSAMAVENVALHFITHGFRVVKHSHIVYDDRSILHLANLWPSCVSMCKIITGYRSWALTPFQLYKSLLQNGGTEIKIEDYEHGGTTKQAQSTSTSRHIKTT